MTTPFDFVKSFTTTKDYLYTAESLFQKEYVPFVVNRALSNDPKCLLFADALNCYPQLDKKLQHDFYFFGIPKMRTGKMWTKKEEEDSQTNLAEFVARDLNVSIKRALELLPLIDEEEIHRIKKSHGGKVGKV